MDNSEPDPNFSHKKLFFQFIVALSIKITIYYAMMNNFWL
jgi:hypothetical protein